MASARRFPAVAPFTMAAVMPSIPCAAPRAVFTAEASMLDRLALTLLIDALARLVSTSTTSSSRLSAMSRYETCYAEQLDEATERGAGHCRYPETDGLLPEPSTPSRASQGARLCLAWHHGRGRGSIATGVDRRSPEWLRLAWPAGSLRASLYHRFRVPVG